MHLLLRTNDAKLSVGTIFLLTGEPKDGEALPIATVVNANMTSKVISFGSVLTLEVENGPKLLLSPHRNGEDSEPRSTLLAAGAHGTYWVIRSVD